MQLILTFLLGAAAGFLACLMLPGLLTRLGFQRTNFEGRSISSAGGVLFAVGAFPWLFIAGSPADRAAAAAVVGFGLLGLLDDRWGSAEHKGLRGHFGALLRGTVTTGMAKAAGGLALAAGLALHLSPGIEAGSSMAVVALSANFVNLLDLRPLRALKCFWLLAAPLVLGSAPAALVFGLSLPYARLEAARRVMLGDAGSNALGGLLGVLAVKALPWWGEITAATALLGLHLWTERHSLSAWIDERGWARAIDRWGVPDQGGSRD